MTEDDFNKAKVIVRNIKELDARFVELDEYLKLGISWLNDGTIANMRELVESFYNKERARLKLELHNV